MGAIEELQAEVQRRADGSQLKILSRVFDGLYSRHLSGFAEGDCLCSYCEGLNAYIAAKRGYRRLRALSWKNEVIFDSDNYQRRLAAAKERFEEQRAKHRIAAELLGSSRPPRRRPIRPPPPAPALERKRLGAFRQEGRWWWRNANGYEELLDWD